MTKEKNNDGEEKSKIISLAVAAIAIVIAMIVVCMSSCNRTILDTTFQFDRAVIKLPDGTIVDGTVESWHDYEGDQIQVKVNGITYLVHANNVALIKN